MDRHRCKLCDKSFGNGRALGGHMRSHMLNLYVPPKPDQLGHQLGEETESASSSSSSSSEEENEEKELGSYGLRENPKKSVKLVDPEFSFVGSVVVQDRESETESSRNPANPVRRRSKRIRKLGTTEQDQSRDHHQLKKHKWVKLGITESEAEPVSSISETSPEEDVAYCLMMLSRDNWNRDEELEPKSQEETENYFEEFDEIKNVKPRIRGKYRCETCNKVFKSYQALGGHRASHKKIRSINNNGGGGLKTEQLEIVNGNVGSSGTVVEEKIHECPVCFRVFSSGQALGGHKRSHVTGSSPSPLIPPSRKAPKFAETLIDLNLPAPMDDDEISQIELSAVSDAEFVNPIRI